MLIHICICPIYLYIINIYIEEVPELLSRYYTLRDATEELLSLNYKQENTIYICIYIYKYAKYIFIIYVEEVPELLSRYYTLRDATEELLALNNEQENETEEFRVKLQALKTEMQNKSLVGKKMIICVLIHISI
jgi:hypothetical protein